MGIEMLILVLAAALAMLIGLYVYSSISSTENLRRHFDSAASKYNLTINCRETFKSGILGIDYLNKKVLYARRTALKPRNALIDLATVTNCSYRKVYLRPATNNKRPQAKLIVNEVLLEFDQEDLKTVSIPFYRRWLHDFPSTDAAELKARRWEILVQKLLEKQPSLD